MRRLFSCGPGAGTVLVNEPPAAPSGGLAVQRADILRNGRGARLAQHAAVARGA